MADNGIKAITDLIESAQSSARQALQSAPPVTKVTGTLSIADDIPARVTGGYPLGSQALPFGGTESTIVINNETFTYRAGQPASAAANQFNTLDQLNDLLRDRNISVRASVSSSYYSDYLQLDGLINDKPFTVSGPIASNYLNSSAPTATRTYEPTNPDLRDSQVWNKTLDIHAGGITRSIRFGNGPNEVSTKAELAKALTEQLDNVSAKLVGDKIEISTKNGDAFEILNTTSDPIDVDSDNVDFFGLRHGEKVVPGGDSQRKGYVTQFNGVLDQLDQLAKDASYNGINLLFGQHLEVLFNEEGTSKLNIEGTTLDHVGLGLSRLDDNAFDSNSSINAVLDKLKGSLDQLRSRASQLGSNLSVVKNRENFTKEMINTLQTGAANLTLADTNEEGANMLALQTRQQLSQTALSLASQADQAVLRLFG
ncbi:hypothetical protein DVH29_02355 [Pelagibacterium lacus]|uniref:Flagellin C-terminal domain-containing protein n=2 Tax=Pelagibacterium lacus TaxID=2282655 RepID=A0A369W6Q8_9HYPH|nr:hypothetical protein DVH29_02355 [Pelagibacterium lacus]